MEYFFIFTNVMYLRGQVKKNLNYFFVKNLTMAWVLT